MAYKSLVLASAIAVATGTAPRYWPRFEGQRLVTTLDGVWSYSLLAAPGYPLGGGDRLPDTHFDSMNRNFGPSSELAMTPNQTNVPSTMDVADAGYLGTRGIAMYRTTFVHPQAARLQFQSCSFYCRVWVDGTEIGEHTAGGFVAFTLNVPAGKDGPRELFVLADNRFNQTTAPMHTGGDFWHYGGLTRSVELHTLPADDSAPWPWRAYVLPHGNSVNITLMLTDKSYEGPLDVSLAFDEGAPALFTATAKAGSIRLNQVPVPNARIWSTTNPQLHTVAVTVNNATVVERFGLREFGVEQDSARLTVNGEVVKLVGWNHHTQWPYTGASPTDEQLDADLALLLAGGANFVRGAHYPQDPRWLDRLDEAGLVMWCETLGPSVKTHNIQDPAWMAVQLKQLDEMLDNALNHASIMTWAWFNEGPSDDEDACPGYAACNIHASRRDPTRFTTFASNKVPNDACLEHASLISLNEYPGWYDTPYDPGTPTEQWNRFADGVRAGTTRSGHHTLGKPMLISETGGGGIFEWDANATDEKWTLGFQTKLLSEDVDVGIANDNISGILIWHLFDFKVGDKESNNTHCEYIPNIYPPICSYIEINHRPGGTNHKGVVDFWRRPKPSYQAVAAKYNATKSQQLLI